MFIFLFVLWIVFNARITLEVVLLGLLFAGLIYLFCIKYLGYNVKKEINMAKKIPVFCRYILLLIKEILIANIVVMKLLLSPEELKPILYHFDVDIKDEGLKVLLSHSITLTPGTITVELVENHYVIHCLDEKLAEGLENSDFIKIIKKLERGA